MPAVPSSSECKKVTLRLPLHDLLQFGKTMKTAGVIAGRTEVEFEFRNGVLTISGENGGSVMAYTGDFHGRLRMAGSSFKQLITSYHRTDKSRPFIHAELDPSAGLLNFEHTRCKVKVVS